MLRKVNRVYWSAFLLSVVKTVVRLKQVITTANQEKGKYLDKPMRTQRKKAKCLKRGKNAGDQVVIGFSFACHWLREWREFSRPITERNNTKPMQSRITFDT